MKKQLRVNDIMIDVSDEVYKEYYRYRRREKYLEAVSAKRNISTSLGVVISDKFCVLDYLIKCEEAQALRAAIDTLEIKERELLYLIYWERYSERATAQKLKISRGAVRFRRNKIIKKLKAQLAKKLAI